MNQLANRYAFHLNLDKGISENITAGIEGRKKHANVILGESEGDAEASPYIHHFAELKTAKNHMKSGFPGDLLRSNKVPGHPFEIFDFVNGWGSYFFAS